MSAIQSSFYSVGGKAIIIILTIGSMAILGRLLTPEDFGIVGIILATHAIFIPIQNMGLKTVYIKMEKVNFEISNVFFTANFILGIISALVLTIAAPMLAHIYDKKLLLPLTFVYSLSIIISSLFQQKYAELQRLKQFGKISLIGIISSSLGIIIGIISAYFGYGAWSLLFKILFSNIFQFIGANLSIKKHHEFVTLTILKKHMHSIKFGGKLVIIWLLGGFSRSIPKLLFGKIYSVDSFGHYERALELANKPIDYIQKSLDAPALAHISRIEKHQYWEAYNIFFYSIILIAGIPCILLILIGDWILPWLMGSQWTQAGKFLQILGIYGFGRVLLGIAEIICINEKKLKFLFNYNIILLIILLPFLLLIGILNYKTVIFVFSTSVIYFFFSLFFLLYLFYILNNNMNYMFQILKTVLLIFFSGILIGFFLKWVILNYLNITNIKILNILIFSCLFLLLLIIEQILINKKQINKFYLFIKRRIVN